jgi:ribosomal protein S18 acetylase RimI-like enzyme
MTTTRSATVADLPAITVLERRVDEHWFGRPEHDEAEIAEDFALLDDPAAQTRLVLGDDGQPIALATRIRTESFLSVDPDVDPAPLHAELLAWLAEAGTPRVHCAERDAALRDALAARGWTYLYSAFDLSRPLAQGWAPAAPRWSDGIEVGEWDEAHARTTYDLIYVGARFADTPGHDARSFDEWHQVFIAGRAAADQPVLAWQGERLVGAAIGRVQVDGTGWINQVAVDESMQGRGIGRALILETFHRRAAAGATSVGLGVMASNRGALALYLDIGLEIEREWQSYAPPDATD